MGIKKLLSHIQNVLTPSRCAFFLFGCSILFLAFWIRIQGADRIPDRQFTDTDGYYFYKQAQLISEHGVLPDRDMSRWVPLGRDLKQTLPFYAYVLAYSHKLIAICFPKISLYQVCLYMPTVCFVMGLGVLMLFLYHSFGVSFSCIVGVLLATLPGYIDRCAVGFGDRDSWCLMIGILAITTYLWAQQTQHPRRRLFFTLASSLSVCVGGLSWEGFGVFLIVILSVELWRFLTSETEERIGLYLLWTLIFVTTLYFVSPVYHSGKSFATHAASGKLFATPVASFMLMPALVLLAMRGCRYLLLMKTPFSKGLLRHARSIALILTGITLTLAFYAVLGGLNKLDNITASFSQNRLMQTIGELRNPGYSFWILKFGGVFVCGSIGFLLTGMHPRNRFGHFLFAVPLTLFILTTFFREPIDLLFAILFNATLDNSIFFAAIAGVVIGFVIQAWQRKTHSPNDILYVAFSTWFFCWVALARDAERYDFFIGVAIAFFTALVIHTFAKTFQEQITRFRFTPTLLKTPRLQSIFTISIACILLSLFLFWAPAGAHTNLSLYAAEKLRKPLPGDGPMAAPIKWMAKKLEKNDVLAANWEYGNQLNVLGGVKTIIGPDHYIPHWIYLFFRHVYAAQSEQEALEFLYTHEVTHLMFTKRDILFTGTFSYLGSDMHRDRRFLPSPLRFIKTENGKPKRLFNPGNTPFYHIDASLGEAPFTLIAHKKDGQKVVLPYVAFLGSERTEKSPDTLDTEKNGGAILYFDSTQHLRKAYFLNSIGWNSLIVRLYIREEHSEAFEPIYPQKDVSFADIKIWKIHYPPDIKKNPKYLETEPSEGY